MKKEKDRKKPEKNREKEDEKEDLLKNDMRLLSRAAAMLEAGNIEEFIDLRSRPWKLIFWNFVIGLFRGIGFLIGATVLGAIIIALGSNFIKEVIDSLGGLPWIGEKIADAFLYIKEIVEESSINGGAE
ncbi:MAG: DUF5665 domain-containing protein [Candidatus Goldiibacteriota bacterium]